MKKILCFTTIVLALNMTGAFAQSKFPLDSILILDKYLGFYTIVDTLEIKDFTSYKEGKSFTFINDKPIDSTGLSAIMHFPTLIKGRIYFNPHLSEEKADEKYYYSISENKINTYKCRFQYDNSIQSFFTVEEYVKLFVVEPYSCRKTLLSDFYPLVETETINNKQYTLGEISEVNFVKSDIALVEICILGEFEGCKDVKYFLVKDNTTKSVTDSLSIDYNKEKYQGYFSDIYFTNKKGYLREKLIVKGWQSSDGYKIDRLFDDNLNYISDVLVLNRPVVMGVNIQENELQNHFLRSFLNNEEKVIIPYKFIPELDLAMYKAYNNNTLTKEDLKSFGEYELGILRNLIFAKHNYDFSSEFYQAYFNLYAFYNAPKMRNTRTTDVNGKLTEADKANLELIKSMELI